MSQVDTARTVNNGRQNPLLSLLPRDGNVIRLLVIVIVLSGLFSLANPDTFPTGRNVRSMALQSSEIGILAIAVAVTMLTGGIDLSINSTANLTGIVAGLTLTALAPQGVALAMTAAIIAGLLVGAACGLLNGFLVAIVKIPAILATLGTFTLYAGIGTAITEGSTVFGIEAFQFIGNGNVLGIPMPLIILVTAAFIVGLILSRTRYGFETYMLGTNPTAARYSGINNTMVLLKTYLIAGMLSAVAGLIILGRTNSANVGFGDTYVLVAILIAVLGGVDPYGGSGRIVGVLLAVFALQILSTGLNQLLRDFSGANFFKEFSWGLLLLVVLLVNYFSYQRRIRRASRE